MQNQYLHIFLSVGACSLAFALIFTGCFQSKENNIEYVSHAMEPQEIPLVVPQEKTKKEKENIEEAEEYQETTPEEDLSQEDIANQLSNVWGPNPYEIVLQDDPFGPPLEKEEERTDDKGYSYENTFDTPPKPLEAEKSSTPPSANEEENTHNKKEVIPEEEKVSPEAKEGNKQQKKELYTRILAKIESMPNIEKQEFILKEIIIAMENTQENTDILILLQEDLPDEINEILNKGILLLVKELSPTEKRAVLTASPEHQ